MLKKTNFVLITLILFLSCNHFKNNQINSQLSNQNASAITESNTISAKDNSVFDFLPTSTTGQVVKHEFYTLSYVEKFEQAEWVAYLLQPQQNRNHFQRPFFVEDNQVKTQSADWKNYKKSGYDKGHLCAAADMAFSKNAYNDTFLTSNISPQEHHFNDGIWNRLEEKVRYWANKYDGIYVVTGGVLTNGLPTIGREGVAVPEYFYKILLKKEGENYKMIAFLMPSQDSNKALYEFVVPTDEVEKLTGIDFYPKLNDSIEVNLERSSDYKSWGF